MTDLQAQPLSAVWKDRLDLSLRVAPELYEDSRDVGRSVHAGAIRIALEDLGAAGVLCVQEVPTVVVVVLDEYDRERIVDLHGRLWNQGLATLLLVLSGNTVRAFSLARKPYQDDGSFEDRCLVRELDAVSNALAVKGFIYGAESGRLWEEQTNYFKPEERIDQVLLDNLTVAYERLRAHEISKDGAQALLIQTMFIAYLEDREIIGPGYFRDASEGRSDSFVSLLESESATALYRLFSTLRVDFNDDLFVSPSAFDMKGLSPRVTRAHMQTLAVFRAGREEMGQGGGQLRFWGYDFKYIPIELVSAVYDRFLGTGSGERRERGAYYTPMFLADTVISALWDRVPASTRTKGHILDPACGSGVFLVRSFQRLCEDWRETHNVQKIRWDSLLMILSRLHGRDIDSGAVRVAVFSLYVALLQEVKPPDIRLLIQCGRLLPDLWDHTLRAQDFFEIPPESLLVDVVIGNPPWSNLNEHDRKSVTWCEERQLPMPGKEDGWAFVWKSLQHLRQGGIAGLLLPAMGFLHNHGRKALEARTRLIGEARILRVINFADLRFQLFAGAVRPAALVIFGRTEADTLGYRFDYWVPKADLNLRMRRVITLSNTDKGMVTSRQVSEDPFIFKRRLWMSDPESKLFGYLSSFPRLGALASEYRRVYRRMDAYEGRWVVGNGFQAVNKERFGDDGYHSERSEFVRSMPYLPIEAFQVIAQEWEHLGTFDDGYEGVVRRKGFERGFSGPRVLVPRGISTPYQRLRATYLEAPLTFDSVILAISAPVQDAYRAKLLSALLNSKILLWFAFHGTASFGSERPEIQQADLLRLPFPVPEDVQQDGPSDAADELVSLIDEASRRAGKSFLLRAGEAEVPRELDGLCYRYFDLGEEEIALVEDTVDNVIPGIQPRQGASTDLWRTAGPSDREAYASALIHSLAPWFDKDATINVTLEARNDDLALLQLRLVDSNRREPYREGNDRAVGQAFQRLGSQINAPLPGNFQLVPDFRLFAGNSL